MKKVLVASDQIYDDGWDPDLNEEMMSIMDILEVLRNAEYEIKHLVRGANTDCNTYYDLGQYFYRLGDDLSLAGDDLSNAVDDEDIE